MRNSNRLNSETGVLDHDSQVKTDTASSISTMCFCDREGYLLITPSRFSYTYMNLRAGEFP